MDEQTINPADVFFKEKAELEQGVMEAVKNFAGKYATDVSINVAVAVQPAIATSGDVVDCRTKGVEIEAKYTQNV